MMQKICLVCGWRGETLHDNDVLAGPGGQLGCPECSRAKRHQNIEVWGYVKVIEADSLEELNYIAVEVLKERLKAAAATLLINSINPQWAQGIGYLRTSPDEIRLVEAAIIREHSSFGEIKYALEKLKKEASSGK